MANVARFTISWLMMLTLLVAVLLGWWRDHKRLEAEIRRLRSPPPHWDTHQVTGPPNTSGYGDIPTAWASKTPDSQKEWLVLEYYKPVKARSVWIYETYNPGAVYRVTVFDQRGNEHLAWDGTDPLSTTSTGGIAKVKFAPAITKIATQRIKIYIDSPRVPGWNEIDAVALVGVGGNKQWAQRAYASSAFGLNDRLPLAFW